MPYVALSTRTDMLEVLSQESAPRRLNAGERMRGCIRCAGVDRRFAAHPARSRCRALISLCTGGLLSDVRCRAWQVDNVLATVLQLLRADELFYWVTPRLERGIATITGAGPRHLPLAAACPCFTDAMRGEGGALSARHIDALFGMCWPTTEALNPCLPNPG